MGCGRSNKDQVGGQCSYRFNYLKYEFIIFRPLWQYYFENNDAVVFLVDCSDRERFVEARDELEFILNDDRLRDTCLLVLANKQDMPSACPISELTDKMGLHKLRQRQWFIQGTCAINGEGLFEGFTWLEDTLKANARAKRSTIT